MVRIDDKYSLEINFSIKNFFVALQDNNNGDITQYCIICSVYLSSAPFLPLQKDWSHQGWELAYTLAR